jgi:hypothetical protein
MMSSQLLPMVRVCSFDRVLADDVQVYLLDH